MAILGGWALIAPNSLCPVYHGWMRMGLLLGKVTTPIVMGAIFFVIILPVGVIMRTGRRDPMRRAFEPGSTSYRVPSEHPPKSNLRPF